MRKMVSFIFGGRPMTNIGLRFVDSINGKPVFKFIDRYGRAWLANNRWSIFKIAVKESKGAPYHPELTE